MEIFSKSAGLGSSFNFFRSFSSEIKVSCRILTCEIYFQYEDLSLNSLITLLDCTTTKAIKSKDNNIEPCALFQTSSSYFFRSSTLFSFIHTDLSLLHQLKLKLS